MKIEDILNQIPNEGDKLRIDESVSVERRGQGAYYISVEPSDSGIARKQETIRLISEITEFAESLEFGQPHRGVSVCTIDSEISVHNNVTCPVDCGKYEVHIFGKVVCLSECRSLGVARLIHRALGLAQTKNPPPRAGDSLLQA